jgi:hypothetical protein
MIKEPQLECSECGSPGEASCACGVAYDYYKVRTNAQKRAAVKTELTKDPERSDRAIAKAARVDHHLVAELRARGGIPTPRPKRKDKAGRVGGGQHTSPSCTKPAESAAPATSNGRADDDPQAADIAKGEAAFDAIAGDDDDDPQAREAARIATNTKWVRGLIFTLSCVEARPDDLIAGCKGDPDELKNLLSDAETVRAFCAELVRLIDSPSQDDLHPDVPCTEFVESAATPGPGKTVH